MLRPLGPLMEDSEAYVAPIQSLLKRDSEYSEDELIIFISTLFQT
jgi:hypothetical protein